MKPPKDRLSLEQLRDILARRKDDPEVLLLLWEIFHYQQVARKSWTLMQSITPVDQTRQMMIDSLTRLLEDDPAVLQMIEMHQELLAPYYAEKKDRRR